MDSNTPSAYNPEKSGFWLSVWLGISLAGGLFGVLLAFTGLAHQGFGAAIAAGPLGFIIGSLFAGIVAVPVVLLMGTASWALATRRWRTFLGIMAGGTTGTLCTLSIVSSEEPVPSLAAFGIGIVVASLLGSAGAWIAAITWARRGGKETHAIGEHGGDAEAPVTNRLGRIGVLVLVIAADFGVVCLIGEARAAARRNHCRNNLKQIARCLQTYEAANRSLPPAYTTDDAGKPLLSWRVAAARQCFYNLDFSEWMAPGQPWNSPKNEAFLNRRYFLDFFHCPSSGKKPENPLTDYVTVVGSDTLWPGKLPGDVKKHPKGILVVEWPNSDIHWAEPRDITVEEFLDWFRREPPHRGLLDWLFAKRSDDDSFHPDRLLYVDAQGDVGELRNDTDVETVRRLLTGQ